MAGDYGVLRKCEHECRLCGGQSEVDQRHPRALPYPAAAHESMGSDEYLWRRSKDQGPVFASVEYRNTEAVWSRPVDRGGIRRKYEWTAALHRFGERGKSGFSERHACCGYRCTAADAVAQRQHHLHTERRLFSLQRTGIEDTEEIFERLRFTAVVHVRQVDRH